MLLFFLPLFSYLTFVLQRKQSLTSKMLHDLLVDQMFSMVGQLFKTQPRPFLCFANALIVIVVVVVVPVVLDVFFAAKA